VASQALSGAVSARVCCCCAGTHSTMQKLPLPQHTHCVTNPLQGLHCRQHSQHWMHVAAQALLPVTPCPQQAAESCVKLTAAGTRKARE
jgi:hypothetical protein